DEFPEFERRVIDSLRQPLEDKVVSISRAKGTAIFPADFILVAAMNPCPCGYWGVKGKPCICNPAAIQRYQRKISGPIIDRIDMWLEVSKVEHDKLATKDLGEKSETVRMRVTKARDIQKKRFQTSQSPIKLNSHMSAKDLIRHISLLPDVKTILDTSAIHLDLSARSYHRLIKLARTIADLEGSTEITTSHILEALQYRPKRQFI
ncbi:MAG: ATP-binding protein, partial [Candidatus Doudnabacteria bacterium]|nr:ATP-binding protein [Candidatus Doudnabacteria bacterium]